MATGGRNRDVIVLNAYNEFNLCPLCWMPLFIDHGKHEDQLWAVVQYVFKGKPAFSIKPSGSHQGRHVMVFGFSELNPRRQRVYAQDAGNVEDAHYIVSCQDCHFIDIALSAVSQAFLHWNGIGESRYVIQSLKRGAGSDNNPSPFFQNLNIEDGLWKDGTFDFVTHVRFDLNFFQTNKAFEILSRTFSGCPDCNMKMSNNKYIIHLFKLLFVFPPSNPGDTTRNGRGRPKSAPLRRLKESDLMEDTESQMYYILLSGMLKKNDMMMGDGQLKRDVDSMNDSAYYFQVENETDRSTWGYRYLILWCMIKILFAAWEDADISKDFRHHISYLFSGVQDFYLSVLFFVMHSANGKMPRNEPPLQFETFHFFYSSHIPFFLINKNQNPEHHRSLSKLILTGTKFRFSIGMTMDDVRTQFVQLKQKVLDFWDSHFKHLSDYIFSEHRTSLPHNIFFCEPTKAAALSRECEKAELNVQSFKEFFTTYPDYWFHFKSITMPKIEQDCKIYYEKSSVPFAKRVWAQWYAYLCACVNDLGKRDGGAASGGAAGGLQTAAVLESLCPQTRWRVVLG